MPNSVFIVPLARGCSECRLFRMCASSREGQANSVLRHASCRHHVGFTPSASAILTRSATDLAPIFFII
jgi:hypothetical protein